MTLYAGSTGKWRYNGEGECTEVVEQEDVGGRAGVGGRAVEGGRRSERQRSSLPHLNGRE